MAKYRLLKDLPTLKKGTILSEGEPIFGVKTLIIKNNGVCTTFISNELFEELFEEIQEEPTDSIHWNPRIGERCFILENANIIPTLYTVKPRDCNAWRTGKIFRTKEECEKARDRELSEARLRRTSTFKPDFENGKGGWVVGYDYLKNKLISMFVRAVDYGEIVHYETYGESEKSIKENKQGWKIYFGIEEER